MKMPLHVYVQGFYGRNREPFSKTCAPKVVREMIHRSFYQDMV